MSWTFRRFVVTYWLAAKFAAHINVSEIARNCFERQHLVLLHKWVNMSPMTDSPVLPSHFVKVIEINVWICSGIMSTLRLICCLTLTYALLLNVSEGYTDTDDTGALLDKLGEYDLSFSDSVPALQNPMTKRGWCRSKFTYSPVLLRCIPSLRVSRSP
ncbi:hypothetical protein KP79_PYT19250 [Mizuhopecten yessoensis]|uniref:Uncharacterized protein n=1 Tax=Mizuhopecten yessoensis TaxID=6573 RepID=A0A210PSC7_MIZYE|nr:hypothetical protein KP79_PYT19250 [Mizuhopecten yessoensis]